MKIKISDITVKGERREINNAKVSELVKSIEALGLINPITVDKNYQLIAGGHRLEAVKELGYEEVDCVVLDCDELLSELAEIDENLIRNELDAISIGEYANRRDEILKELAMRAKSGDNRHTKSRGAVSAPLKTTADIAKEIGTSERTLQENKQLARNLDPEVKKAVREKGLSKSAALDISRLKPEQQREVIAADTKEEVIAATRKIRDAKKQKEMKVKGKTVAQEDAEQSEVPEAVESDTEQDATSSLDRLHEALNGYLNDPSISDKERVPECVRLFTTIVDSFHNDFRCRSKFLRDLCSEMGKYGAPSPSEWDND